MPPVINKKDCIACGICVEICPVQVFRQPESQKPPIVKFPQECWHCNACVLDCPQNAISLKVPLPFMMLHVDAADLKPGGSENV